VGDKVSISAQAGVLSDLEPGATVYGTPALPGPVAKRMHLYSLKLGDLFQQVKQLQRRLEELDGRETRSLAHWDRKKFWRYCRIATRFCS